MEMSFYVTSERLEETKKKIRSLDSLRFIHDPLQAGKEFNISISGDVKDMNELNILLSKYHEEDKKNNNSKKKNFFSDFFVLNKRKEYGEEENAS